MIFLHVWTIAWLIWDGLWLTAGLFLLARKLTRVLVKQPIEQRRATSAAEIATVKNDAARERWIDPDPELPYAAEVARQRWIRDNDWSALAEMTAAMEPQPEPSHVEVVVAHEKPLGMTVAIEGRMGYQFCTVRGNTEYYAEYLQPEPSTRDSIPKTTRPESCSANAAKK